jgi:hypothetical protein
VKLLPKRSSFRASSRYAKHSVNALFMCGKKSKFKSRKHARQFLHSRGIASMHPYDCPYCNGVHIGHGQKEY